MSVVAAAVVGAAVVGGVAANQASKKGAAAANNATQVAQDQYAQNRTDAMPYREAGNAALGSLVSGLGLGSSLAPAESAEQIRLRLQPQFTGNYGGNGVDDAGLDAATQSEYQNQSVRRAAQENPSSGQSGTGDLNRSFTLADFQKDPGYDFRQQQGQNALESSASARGGILSGAALKATDRYNQDYASGEYQNAYNRFNTDQTNRFNRLSSLAGLGQTTNTQLSNQGTALAGQVGENGIQAANATGAGYVGMANSITGATQTLGNWNQQQQLLDKLKTNGSIYSPSYGGSSYNGYAGYDGTPAVSTLGG